MYRKILVALENSAADESLLPHIYEFARLFQSELVLLHVADGWAARNFDHLKLAESEEMKKDRDYLERKASELSAGGLRVSIQLALGEPSKEILKTAETQKCDLIAMTSHGHRWLADLFRGSTIATVRHKTSVPILLVRAGTSLL
jgi:manganese transport protein